MKKNKKIKELSKGMKIKLSIALALAHDPELLILDEPTSGLDPIIRSEILDILLEVIQDENKSILFSSHITEDIEKVADYVTYIVDGNIVLSEEKDEVLSNYKKVYVSNEEKNKEIINNLKCVNTSPYGIVGISNDYSKLEKEINTSIKDDSIKIKNEVYEQKNKGYSLLKNLPIKQYKIVISKFLTTLLLGFFGIIYTSILTFILFDENVLNLKYISPLIGAVIVSSIIVGIFYMISYKVGAEKANTFIFMLLGILMLLGQVAFFFVNSTFIRNIILSIEDFFKYTNGYFLLLSGLIIYLVTMLMSIRLFKHSKVL